MPWPSASSPLAQHRSPTRSRSGGQAFPFVNLNLGRRGSSSLGLTSMILIYVSRVRTWRVPTHVLLFDVVRWWLRGCVARGVERWGFLTLWGHNIPWIDKNIANHPKISPTLPCKLHAEHALCTSAPLNTLMHHRNKNGTASVGFFQDLAAVCMNWGSEQCRTLVGLWSRKWGQSCRRRLEHMTP